VAWCLCRRTGNDGRIPMKVWTSRWKPRARKELIEAGLAEVDGDAVEMHDWLDHQPSAAELDAKRLVRAEAGRKGGKRSGETRSGRSKPASMSEANAEANASTGTGHKPVTSLEFSSEWSTQTGSTDATSIPTVSDSVEMLSPAETAQNSEAIASDVLHQMLNQTANSNEPDKDKDIDISGDVMGERHLVDARASSNEPPKFHAGHDDQWFGDCAECNALSEAYIAWKRERAAEIRASAGGLGVRPAQRCYQHLENPNAPNCGKCRDARHIAEAWDAERKRRLRDLGDARRAGIATCADRRAAAGLPPLCDSEGWRIPPPELEALDPPVVRCDHFDTLPASWRALIANVINSTATEE
ncbi:hypothetical protein ACIA5H_37115, partial [Nocardia sp. NPDC051900]